MTHFRPFHPALLGVALGVTLLTGVTIPLAAPAKGTMALVDITSPLTKAKMGSALLEKVIRINRPDLRARGRLILRSLSPMAGELRLREARGNPRWLFSRLPSGTTRSLLTQHLDIRNLSLKAMRIFTSGNGFEFGAAQIAIPEGAWANLSGRLGHSGNWQLQSGPFQWTRSWPQWGSWQPLLPVGFKTLAAAGDRTGGEVHITNFFLHDIAAQGLLIRADTHPQFGQEALQATVEVTLSQVRIPAKRILAAQAGFAEELFRATGFEPHPVDGLHLHRVYLRATLEERKIRLQTVEMAGPGFKLQGSGRGRWTPAPGQLHMHWTVKTAEKPEKQFKTAFSLPWTDRLAALQNQRSPAGSPKNSPMDLL